MKRVFVLAALPVLLLALERVNLIKDAGFEKDSDVWLMRSDADGEYDSTIYNSHDPDSAYIEYYCASIDGRIRPATTLPDPYGIEGNLYQAFTYPKKLIDLDSLVFYHMPILRDHSKGNAWSYGVLLKLRRDIDEALIRVYYIWGAPDLGDPSENAFKKVISDTINDEGIWYELKRSLNVDLISMKGLSPDNILDSFFLQIAEVDFNGNWRSQKAFFDGIRLTGYADYDVGIKEILSGDSLEKDTPYTPIARIKNFGRENAPEFSVIAEIFEGTTRVYYDSLPWSLTSDTEDTVTFAAFTPTNAANHTLVVRTSMSPDESDEDDALSKTLYGSGIEEQPIPSGLVFEVSSFTTSPRVSYSLPASEQGTITLYDPTGRRVESLKVQGTGQVNLRSKLASGVYFVKLETGKTSVTKKAVVLK